MQFASDVLEVENPDDCSQANHDFPDQQLQDVIRTKSPQGCAGLGAHAHVGSPARSTDVYAAAELLLRPLRRCRTASSGRYARRTASTAVTPGRIASVNYLLTT